MASKRKSMIPIRRKVPVFNKESYVISYSETNGDNLLTRKPSGEGSSSLAEFLHLEQQSKSEVAECKDHEAAGGNPPSNTTLVEEEGMNQNPSNSTNPNGQHISQHQVSQLQVQAKEAKSSCTSSLAEEPVVLKERGQFISEHQLTQIMETAQEQERVSKILKSLSQKTKGVLEDIGKNEKKWPQSRREITGVIMAVIVAAVAVCLFTFWYPKRVETTVPTWGNYLTSICMRILSLYK